MPGPQAELAIAASLNIRLNRHRLTTRHDDPTRIGHARTTRVGPWSGYPMVDLPAGTFEMGTTKEEDPERDPDEGLPDGETRTTTVSAFSMGRVELTRGTWRRVYREKRPRWMLREDPNGGGVDSEPVGPAACDVTPVAGANGWRLPTEAEREYAARAGTRHKYGCVAQEGELLDCANFGGAEDGYRGVMPVGTNLGNAWGIYDTAGNVLEWVWDWYAPYVHTTEANNPSRPAAPGDWAKRVIRGGSCWNESRWARVSNRAARSPSFVTASLGFRLSRSTPTP